MWYRSVVFITTEQLLFIKPELGFCSRSKLDSDVVEICNGENLTKIPTGNEPQHFSLVRHSPEQIIIMTNDRLKA